MLCLPCYFNHTTNKQTIELFQKTQTLSKNRLETWMCESTFILMEIKDNITDYFHCLHTKSLLVTQFLKPDTQTPEPHTTSAKPYTNYWPLTQFSIS